MRAVVVGGVFVLLCAAPCWAGNANVSFQGILGVSCTLAVTTPGTLALSADGMTMGSEQSGGVPAIVTITAIGTSTVTVAAPTLTPPAGYDASDQRLEVSYAGLSGLSGVSQAFTASSTNFPVSVLAALQVQNHIVNPNGFVPGTYTTQTVITCS